MTIERLRELERAATEAPWAGRETEQWWKIAGNKPSGGTKGLGMFLKLNNQSLEDRDLCIATRNALPAMLAVIEAAEAEIRSAREFRSRLQEYSLSYLDAKGERSEDMERRLVGGYSKLKANTDAALAAFREVRE